MDAHGKGMAVFDPKAYAAGTPSNSPGILYHAIDSSIPNSGVSGRAIFPEPRIGFSWDPRGNSRTILRGGFGVYRQHDSYNDMLNVANTAIGQRTASVTSRPTFATLYAYQSTVAAGKFAPDNDITALSADDDEQPRVRTYNLALDQRISKNITASKLINIWMDRPCVWPLSASREP